MRIEYFIVLSLILFFPFILSFDRRLEMYKNWRALLVAITGMCLPFWFWDVVAASRGHWRFNELYTVGLDFLGLPVEEWLFFPILGFVSVFTWEAIKHVRERRKQV